MNKEKPRKMRQKSDRHITVTRNSKKLIDNGKLTVLGKRALDINARKKEQLRKELYQRDGRQSHYCRIEEKDVIAIWGKFYGIGKRGKCLELDRKDSSKGYSVCLILLHMQLC